MARTEKTFLGLRAERSAGCLEWGLIVILGSWAFLFGMVSLMFLFDESSLTAFGIGCALLPGIPCWKLLQVRRYRKQARMIARHMAQCPTETMPLDAFVQQVHLAKDPVKTLQMLLDKGYLKALQVDYMQRVIHVGGEVAPMPKGQPIKRVIKCEQCGASVSVGRRRRRVQCEYCGTEILLPKQ